MKARTDDRVVAEPFRRPKLKTARGSAAFRPIELRPQPRPFLVQALPLRSRKPGR